MSGAKRRGPESEAWDLLKGREVHLGYLDGSADQGVLRWVDFYTVGLQRAGEDCVTIVFKQALRRVMPAP